jgi:tRNA (cmo5U34)-methyltransferase
MQIPKDWTFKSKDVANGFDAHVREQLPWYDLATFATAHVARHYIPRGGLVYDIGSSTGNIGRALAPTLQSRGARLVAIDDSLEMAALYKGPGEIVVGDASAHDYEDFDIAVCFLVLMFLAPEAVERLIAKLQSRMRRGGAIIVFDKMEPLGGYPGTIMSRLTLAGKLHNKVAIPDVLAKELSLAGVQRPIHASVFGGNAVEFFRFGDFAGWLIEPAPPKIRKTPPYCRPVGDRVLW